MKLSTWRSALAWVGALFVLIVVTPGTLDAHARLVRSAPSSREHLATSPAQLRLWFSEPLQLTLTRVQLVGGGSDSTAVPLGPLTSGNEMSVTLAILAPLKAGTYTVVWRAAAADGHPSTGRFTFIVDGDSASPVPAGTAGADTSARRRDSLSRVGDDRGNAIIVPSRDTSAMVSGRGYIAARWLELIALLAAIGAVVFRFGLGFVVRPVGGEAGAGTSGLSVLDAVLRLLRPMLALLLVANLIRLGGEWQLVREQGMDISVRQLLGTGWGQGWLSGVIGALIAGIGAVFARRRAIGWAIVAGGVLVAAITPAITGHAIASPDHRALAISADLLHVLGGGAWIGTLLVIVVAVLPTLRDQHPDSWGSHTSVLLTAFSPIALTGAAVVLASGVLSGWLRLGSLAALWQTSYGKVLLLKVALAMTIALIGAWNWRAMQPAVAAGESPTRIRRSASLELATAALLLIVTAILIAMPTPV